MQHITLIVHKKRNIVLISTSFPTVWRSFEEAQERILTKYPNAKKVDPSVLNWKPSQFWELDPEIFDFHVYEIPE
jgi:hypothetical protein